jgi:hypothetical protein
MLVHVLFFPLGFSSFDGFKKIFVTALGLRVQGERLHQRLVLLLANSFSENNPHLAKLIIHKTLVDKAKRK